MGDEERVAAEQRERLRAERKKDRERDLRIDVRKATSLLFCWVVFVVASFAREGRRGGWGVMCAVCFDQG